MEIINTIGRRKTAVARIYMQPGDGKITINKRDLEQYFTVETLQNVVKKPLELVNYTDKFDIKANLDGGGIKGQAEALRLAISRAIIELEPEHRPVLKMNGCLVSKSARLQTKLNYLLIAKSECKHKFRSQCQEQISKNYSTQVYILDTLKESGTQIWPHTFLWSAMVFTFSIYTKQQPK